MSFALPVAHRSTCPRRAKPALLELPSGTPKYITPDMAFTRNVTVVGGTQSSVSSNCGRRRPKKSQKYVLGRREENAGAAGLSPDTMINAVELGPVVVAWVQLLVADHQLAVKQMQLFNSGMAVTRIVGSRREPYQHADAVFLRIGREQFAGDARRHFFPFRFSR